MKRIAIPVVGMTCAHCVRAITKALEELRGVKEVILSLETNIADVTYDERFVTLEAMKQVIEEEGYGIGPM